MVRRRLTRREIVQASWLEATLSRSYVWSSENRRLLISSLGAILLAIAGTYWWQDYQQRQTRKIQTSFAQALELYHAPVGEKTGDGQDEGRISSRYRFSSDDERRDRALEAFRSIADRHPSANIAIVAQYYTGLLLNELNQREEARKLLGSVILESEQPEIRNMARNTLAQMLEAEDQPGEASELLKEILEDAAPSFPEEPVLFRLAQDHETVNNADEALKFYRRLLADYPSSGYAGEARERIQQLEASAELVSQD